MRIHSWREGLDLLPSTTAVTIRCYPHHGPYTEHTIDLGEIRDDIDADGYLSRNDWMDVDGQIVTLPEKRAIRALYVTQLRTHDGYVVRNERQLYHWFDHRHDLKYVRLKVTRYDGRFEYLHISMREANRVLSATMAPLYQRGIFHVTKIDGKNRKIHKQNTRSITFEYVVLVPKA